MRCFLMICFSFLLAACGEQDPNTLNVGTIAGPETDLVAVAADVAKKEYGLTLNIIEFSDFNLPNEALQDGSLDANVYQHLPYLKEAIKARGLTLEPIGKTFVYPMAVYSKKHTNIKALPDGAIIALPNDPSNEFRALLLLKKAGLITLKNTNQHSVDDIESNPHQFQFKELDAAQLPRVLDDVDAAVINTTFAIPAGLNPNTDAIYSEDKDSPYANIIVINSNSKKKDKLKQFVKALNSKQVLKKAKGIFGDGAIPAW